ncbi:hypothetical protein Q8A67_024271 [Cirrhinus molitorella]|uniref:Uncharacterized protein n=1 Tax=Cirrhinus molitorella TaxID=172907 RepID=A0AA88P4N9_9TELE|nr:hypothetical protein Q8A67_024271 [Cirrhinus molitorella]
MEATVADAQIHATLRKTAPQRDGEKKHADSHSEFKEHGAGPGPHTLDLSPRASGLPLTRALFSLTNDTPE